MNQRTSTSRIALAFGAVLFILLASTSPRPAGAAETTSCMEACLAENGFQFVDDNGELRRYDYCTTSSSGAITCYYEVVP